MINLSFPIEVYYLSVLFYGMTFLFSLMKMKRFCIIFLRVAFMVNLISEVSGRYLVWPFCNMFSEPFFLPLCLSGTSLVLIGCKRQQEAFLIVPLVVLFSIIPVFFSEGYYPPFTLMSRSIYAHLFHLCAFVSHGLLITGAYLALLSLFLRIEYGLIYRLVAWGFALLCTAGMFGMLWSYVGRSDVISWNHYYFHSIAIWFYYVGFLHLHLTMGWNQKRKALVLLGGAFLILWFDYLPQIGGIHAPGVLNANLYRLY